MKAFVEKNKHNMCLAKASAKKFVCLKKMSVKGFLKSKMLLNENKKALLLKMCCFL